MIQVRVYCFVHWTEGVRASLWRNRLARSTVNRKVGGSSPPRDVINFCQASLLEESIMADEISSHSLQLWFFLWRNMWNRHFFEGPKHLSSSTGGSVVECSPATRAARVRFPASATFFILDGRWPHTWFCRLCAVVLPGHEICAI